MKDEYRKGTVWESNDGNRRVRIQREMPGWGHGQEWLEVINLETRRPFMITPQGLTRKYRPTVAPTV